MNPEFDRVYHEFCAAIERTIELYESLLGPGIQAVRTRRMIERYKRLYPPYGVIEAVAKLMISPDLQPGFRVLRDHDLLDKTFEAQVICFEKLFLVRGHEKAVECARWRLTNPGELF